MIINVIFSGLLQSVKTIMKKIIIFKLKESIRIGVAVGRIANFIRHSKAKKNVVRLERAHIATLMKWMQSLKLKMPP